MIQLKFTFDIKPFEKVVDQLQKEPMDAPCRKQVAFRYLGAMKQRYVNQGNGSWAPLAESTIKKRRKNSDVPLRNNGQLLAALDMGAQGNFVGPLPDGVRVGFANTPHSNGKTYRQIAEIHDAGDGVPERKILVDPDEATIGDIMKYMKARLERLTK